MPAENSVVALECFADGRISDDQPHLAIVNPPLGRKDVISAAESQARLHAWRDVPEILFTSADELTDVPRDAGSAEASAATLPIPVEPESFSMPPNDRFRLDKHKRLAPIRPKSKEDHPQEPI